MGILLGLDGLAVATNIVRSELGEDMCVIYDHQKAGNDIPDMGMQFARKLKSAGVDVAILFPFAGPRTQQYWTETCLGEGLQVMTGGIMTHPEFLFSEGGSIADEAPETIYRYACGLGVEHFVVPGNKLDWTARIYGWLVNELGKENFTLSAPGFITQGGVVKEWAKIAGNHYHAIVGSGIYKAEDPRAAALAISQMIP